MRKILFRGKRVEDGEWVQGSLYRTNTNYSNGKVKLLYRICVFEYNVGKDELDLISASGFDDEVTPETVGQYTGLTDKNGTKIFEGDILSTENGTFSNTGMGNILFYKGMWTSFYGQDALGRDCFDELHAVCSEREIIGNIHDNHELMEGEQSAEVEK